MQPGGPGEILAGAMGPKGLARAARWADGVSGFALTADGAGDGRRRPGRRAGMGRRRAMDAAPARSSGYFTVLGTKDDQGVLQAFTYDYLAIFGTRLAHALADTAPRC